MNSTQIKIIGSELCFGEGLRLSFQRTLRIPDDGRDYPLPPGLGSFPLCRVDDFADRVPEEWLGRGGVFLPMYQREAMWLAFRGQHWKPRALKIAAGKVCAITGKRWSEALHDEPQDYIVTPPQPWLDGIATGRGLIRQFVAMPLGMGYTVEGQVTGEETFGGVQLKVFEPRPGRFPDRPPPPPAFAAGRGNMGAPPAPGCPPMAMACPAPARPRAASMGLSAGGRMKQKIYPDPHGIDTWDPGQAARVFVHIVSSEVWRQITGSEAPPTPVTAKSYSAHGLPWFSLYDEHASALDAQPSLAAVKSVAELDKSKFGVVLSDEEPVQPGPVKSLALPLGPNGVRDGNW